MVLGAASFATARAVKVEVQKASEALANGEEVVLELPAEHQQVLIATIARTPEFQRKIESGRALNAEWALPAVGAGAGATIGYTAGAIVDSLTLTHPAGAPLGKLLLAILGGVLGYKVAKDTPVVAIDQNPAGLIARLKK